MFPELKGKNLGDLCAKKRQISPLMAQKEDVLAKAGDDLEDFSNIVVRTFLRIAEFPKTKVGCNFRF